MAISSKGALSFKVIGRVGRGEQVVVCGDAPFLGGGDPEKALPLFTTPADYPLWFSKEDLPRPAGSKTVHKYRYCVNRGGRFHRWDTVKQPRIIRTSRTPQLARDTLDKEPSEEEEEDEDEELREDATDTTSQGSANPPGSLDDGGDLDTKSDKREYHGLDTETATEVASDDGGGGGGEHRGGEATAASGGDAAAQGTGAAGDPARPSVVPDDDEMSDSVPPLHFGAEGHDVDQPIPTLWRPPSLEADDREGAGLGLGLRLGVDAMCSPPPRAVAEKTKASPPPWSPRDGSVIVASFYLPVTLTKRSRSVDGACVDEWSAGWDHEQLIALQTDLRVVRVGTVKCDHEIRKEDEAAVVQALLKLNCVPVFLSESLAHQCYYSYCKGVLWPVMHGMLEMYESLPNTLLDDKAITSGWQAYKQVNRTFRDKVVEVFHDGDLVWVHGFHLAILPAFLDRAVKVARIGLFLHTPFPPSELFRALPHREDLLRGMLGADQIGFHRFSDRRHFVSSCRRLLGLTHLRNQETGLVQIVHGGKPTILTECHAGVDPVGVRASLRTEESQAEVARLRGLHEDRVVVGGVERVEKIKGVWLKLLAFEDMLRRHPHLVGRVSMHEVGIANPARGEDYRACQNSLCELAERINTQHGAGTVVYEERDAKEYTLAHRAALMKVSSVFVKTPVHNGLSIMPIEFRVVQEQRRIEEAKDAARSSGGTSASGAVSSSAPGVLIISEAVSCSPVLVGSFAVNPWQVEAVSEAIRVAITAEDADRTLWHEEDVEWCESNTTARWAENVLSVLTMVAKENRSRYATTGLGLSSRVVGTDPSFKRLDTASARRAYGLSNSRVFFLDYGGTLVKDAPSSARARVMSEPGHDPGKSMEFLLHPGPAVLEGLAELCRDRRNVVFVVSGRGKVELQESFGHIKGLGLAAEHGSFFRWPQDSSKDASEDASEDVSEDRESDGWEALHPGLMDTAWKDVARRFMQDFQMHTHGSYIEEKGTAILWHYGNAEPEFGAIQAKQLQDELTDVLRFSSAACNTSPSPCLSPEAADSVTSSANVKPNLNNTNMALNVNMNVGAAAVASSITRSNSVASEGVGYGSIEIIHEEGLNSGGEGGGAYLEVRAKGANKGKFVHMVLDRLGWPADGISSAGDPPADEVAVTPSSFPGGRFCLCVGDDVSDEDMFVAAKLYKGTTSPLSPKDACSGYHSGDTASFVARPASTPTGKENCTPDDSDVGRQEKGWSKHHSKEAHHQRQQKNHFLTVTVGSKPSDADAWLPGVDDVVSLLRTLSRVRRTTRHGSAPRSSLASKSNSAAHTAAVAAAAAAAAAAGAAGAATISTPPPWQPRVTQSVSPTRASRSASASNADASVGISPAMNQLLSGGGRVLEGTEPCEATLARSSAVTRAMAVGPGMPVVRRHSYTIGGKPRISLSLAEFLREVAQPEPEPPMF